MKTRDIYSSTAPLVPEFGTIFKFLGNLAQTMRLLFLPKGVLLVLALWKLWCWPAGAFGSSEMDPSSNTSGLVLELGRLVSSMRSPCLSAG